MLKRLLEKIKYFSSHSVQVNELQPGDHIYVWRNVRHILMYQHHGVYIGNGRCIHFTTRADAIQYDTKPKQDSNISSIPDQNQQINSSSIPNDIESQNDSAKTIKLIEKDLKYNKNTKQFEVNNVKVIDETVEQEQNQKKKSLWEKLDPNAKINKALIMETSLDYFLFGGKLKRARYNTPFIEYISKSAGTCYRYQRVDGQQTVEAAKKYLCPTNANGEKEFYSIHRNNCEHLVLEWTTGKRQSHQLYRLMRRLFYAQLFFFPIYKVSDHFLFDLFDSYIKVTVFYETGLSFWVYLATFIL